MSVPSGVVWHCAFLIPALSLHYSGKGKGGGGGVSSSNLADLFLLRGNGMPTTGMFGNAVML